jgi:hypothetical protein
MMVNPTISMMPPRTRAQHENGLPERGIRRLELSGHHRPINHDQNQAGSRAATSPKAAMSAPVMRMTIIAVPGIIHALLVAQAL